jgi:enoyl-CoA hydratase/carnithine racemase
VDYVEVTVPDDGVVTITMNDPKRYNAMSSSLVGDMLEALGHVRQLRACRCVVITGAGRGFCAGADLSFTPDLPPDGEGRSELGVAYKAQQHLSDLIVAIHELPKPVIAAVHGAAIGGGLGIACACDVRVGAPSAKFSARFIRIGLTGLDMGVSYLLPRIIGAGRAAELILTSRDFGADEAERIGLLNRLVPEESLLAEAVGLATTIAGHTELGTWLTKTGLWANVSASSLRQAIELENRSQVLGIMNGNLEEGGRAVMERRKPTWKLL